MIKKTFANDRNPAERDRDGRFSGGCQSAVSQRRQTNGEAGEQSTSNDQPLG